MPKTLHQLTDKKKLELRSSESSSSVFIIYITHKVTHVHKPLRKHMNNENFKNENKILEEEVKAMTENDRQRGSKKLENRRE